MEAEASIPTVVLVTEDRFAALVRMFMESPKFKGYSDSTRDLWGRELVRASHPDGLGAKSIQEVRPSLIQAYIDGMAGRPGKQTAALSALKQLEKWAVVRDHLPRDITKGVQAEHPQGGHMPWSDEQVALAELHLRPSISRAITLASNTGQRLSDLVRMGPTDIEVFDGLNGINVTQQKTGKRIWVPITSRLAEAMKSWERRPGPFLTRTDGAPWRRKALSHAWSVEREEHPKLAPLKAAGLVMHGLRGTACVRLRRSGATEGQIAAMVGMSVEMVERYCRFSDQKMNASAAVFKLERTIGEHASAKSARIAK